MYQDPLYGICGEETLQTLPRHVSWREPAAAWLRRPADGKAGEKSSFFISLRTGLRAIVPEGNEKEIYGQKDLIQPRTTVRRKVEAEKMGQATASAQNHQDVDITYRIVANIDLNLPAIRSVVTT